MTFKLVDREDTPASIQNTVLHSIELQDRRGSPRYSHVATCEYVGAPQKVVQAPLLPWVNVILNPFVRGFPAKCLPDLLETFEILTTKSG